MASYLIPPPTPMSTKGDLCANWKTFNQAWDYFIIATELNNKDLSIQAAALCSIMGQDAVKVINSLTTLSDDDKKKLAEILKRLSEHFINKRHVVFERSKLLDCNQVGHEGVDAYVVRLPQHAETCEFEALEFGFIMDHFLKGTYDSINWVFSWQFSTNLIFPLHASRFVAS